ncbi:fumarylacetoacetate hydrolase family protein [Neiella marina]|uniref:Fumarylacetoacetate hydrolase family protein n=1 Tax=Neiella holothuriorum TaxID=2870530 RepID=A0ABS7EHC7_9GAMM|nr:fumarylacetoacetate hydrolase family protein [Neiella holothuriorum]MBW8191742.1 fumarylacetoacetate hydrolase family protein [Neiella holothuriorum]
MKTTLLTLVHNTPNKLACIGRNYVEHIKELGNEIPDDMVVFCKPNSAISKTLHSQHQGEPLHYEAELCLLIQQGQIAGVGVGLDLTKRDLQSRLKAKGLPWERAKAFDGAAVLSDFVALDHVPDELRFELWVNDERRQYGEPALMMYKPPQILAELQSFMTLQDGDVVMTGTPKGVGAVEAGKDYQVKLFVGEQCVLSQHWPAQP